MNCTEIKKSLSAYIDRQLPTWEKTDVVQHAENCLDCQTEIKSLLQLKRRLRGYSLPGMPAELRAAIEAETLEKAARQRTWSVRWWVPTLAMAGALGGWLLFNWAETHVRSTTAEALLALQTAPQPKVRMRGEQIAWHHDPTASQKQPQ